MGLGLAQGKALSEILQELGMVAEGVRTTRIVRVLAEREALHKTTIDLLGDSWLEACREWASEDIEPESGVVL